MDFVFNEEGNRRNNLPSSPSILTTILVSTCILNYPVQILLLPLYMGVTKVWRHPSIQVLF